jgi:hypothetical protein
MGRSGNSLAIGLNGQGMCQKDEKITAAAIKITSILPIVQ